MTYRTGKTVPNTLYDDDVFIGSAITGHKASRLVDAANRGLAVGELSRDDLAKAIQSDYLGDTTDAIAALIGLRRDEQPDGGE